MYRATKCDLSRYASGVENPRGHACFAVMKRCEASRGRRGPRPWRRFIGIDVEHGISVLDGRLLPGTGSHRDTNARAATADCGGCGCQTEHSQRPITPPSLTKQGGAEPSGSLSLLIVAIEMRETGNGRKPQSSQGGGLDDAPSGQTRSFNHPRE